MKAEITKFICVQETLQIKEITLLSCEEYEAARNNIPMLYGWWWLRTPGNDSYNVAGVCPDGSVNGDGYYVYNGAMGVRPALRFDPKTVNLPVGNEFLFKTWRWTVINDGLALCNSLIDHRPFTYSYKERDANVYDTSDLKKYIEERFSMGR